MMMMREPRGRVQQSILEVLDHQSGLATPKLAASVYGARIPSPAQYAAVRRALCNLRSTGAVISWRGEGRALRWKAANV